jgi:hypothetical protein
VSISREAKAFCLVDKFETRSATSGGGEVEAGRMSTSTETFGGITVLSVIDNLFEGAEFGDDVKISALAEGDA